MKNWIQSMATGLLLERPAQKLTLTEHASRLEESAGQLGERLASAAGTEANRERLRHMIGIERWGQSRLQVFLGEPLVEDEYDTYLPSPDQGWDALQAEFIAAREGTIALAHDLAAAHIDTGVTVPHNQYGKLTAYAWLRYLDTHATLEGDGIQ